MKKINILILVAFFIIAIIGFVGAAYPECYIPRDPAMGIMSSLQGESCSGMPSYSAIRNSEGMSSCNNWVENEHQAACYRNPNLRCFYSQFVKDYPNGLDSRYVNPPEADNDCKTEVFSGWYNEPGTTGYGFGWYDNQGKMNCEPDANKKKIVKVDGENKEVKATGDRTDTNVCLNGRCSVTPCGQKQTKCYGEEVAYASEKQGFYCAEGRNNWANGDFLGERELCNSFTITLADYPDSDYNSMAVSLEYRPYIKKEVQDCCSDIIRKNDYPAEVNLTYQGDPVAWVYSSKNIGFGEVLGGDTCCKGGEICCRTTWCLDLNLGALSGGKYSEASIIQMISHLLERSKYNKNPECELNVPLGKLDRLFKKTAPCDGHKTGMLPTLLDIIGVEENLGDMGDILQTVLGTGSWLKIPCSKGPQKLYFCDDITTQDSSITGQAISTSSKPEFIPNPADSKCIFDVMKNGQKKGQLIFSNYFVYSSSMSNSEYKNVKVILGDVNSKINLATSYKCVGEFKCENVPNQEICSQLQTYGCKWQLDKCVDNPNDDLIPGCDSARTSTDCQNANLIPGASCTWKNIEETMTAIEKTELAAERKEMANMINVATSPVIFTDVGLVWVEDLNTRNFNPMWLDETYAEQNLFFWSYLYTIGFDWKNCMHTNSVILNNIKPVNWDFANFLMNRGTILKGKPTKEFTCGGLLTASGDLNNDKLVDVNDINLVVAAIGTNGAGLKADLNKDGVVNSADLIVIFEMVSNPTARVDSLMDGYEKCLPSRVSSLKMSFP